MKLDEFDFHLPENLIAQTPLKERTNSRLLAVNKKTGELSDKHFYDVADYFEAGDVLVLNDTKVLPARLFGIKEDTGAKIEMLLLKPIDTGYEVLIRPSKKVSPGTKVVFGEGKLQAVCIEKFDEGIHHMELIYDGILENVL